jgi:hypothetical protein
MRFESRDREIFTLAARFGFGIPTRHIVTGFLRAAFDCRGINAMTSAGAQKRTTPPKRSMFAWRRRLSPRVMQCPR